MNARSMFSTSFRFNSVQFPKEFNAFNDIFKLRTERIEWNKCVCTSIETKCGLSDLENNSVRLQHSHKELGKSLNKKMQEKNRNHINAKN